MQFVASETPPLPGFQTGSAFPNALPMNRYHIMGANLRVQGGRAAAASRPRDLCSLGGSSVLCAWLSRSIRCHVIPFWESVGCPPPQSSGELGWRQRVGGWASLGAPARKLSSCWLPDGSIIKWDWARHDSRHSRGYGRDLVVYVG